jgi:SAM-dependent methyltransferase
MPERDQRTLEGRRRWRVALQDLGDTVLDRVLGIETARWVQHDRLEFDPTVGQQYQPSNWLNLLLLWRFLRSAGDLKHESFLDLGCGKGQVLLLAARFPFRRVVGVELSPSVMQVAQRNIEHVRDRLRAPVEIVQADAALFQVPPDITMCYLYMPFPTHVYRVVVEQLVRSIESHPRRTRIVYLHPSEEDRAVPIEHGFQERVRKRGLFVYERA